MFVLSILNKKGGVGKTTITTNLAQCLTILGQKVLVIDNDEQHNLSTSLGIKLRNCTKGLADVLVAAAATPAKKLNAKKLNDVVAEAIYGSMVDGLDCIPGGRALDNIVARPDALKDVLECDVIKSLEYDIVLIDNAPTLSHNTICAINCSTAFLLPVQLRQYALDGLAEMYRILQVEYKIPTERIMIVRNMYKETIASRRIASEAVAATYSASVLDTIIPEDETFEKVVAASKSMFFSFTRSKGTLVFHDLVCEIFEFNKEEMLDKLIKKVKEYRSEIATDNLNKSRARNLFVKNSAETQERG